MTHPMPEKAAPEASGNDQGEERRDGRKDRRRTDRDRRDPERASEEIAPRRHPEIKGRREYDV